MAWQKIGTDTLTGSAQGITVEGVSAENNQFINHTISVSNGDIEWRLGKTTIDTGSNYAYRRNSNGGGDSTFTTQTFIRAADAVSGGSDDYLIVAYAVNVSTQEKLLISNSIRNISNSGAGSVPARNEIVGKWVNTTDQFDNTFVGGSSGTNIATDSNLTVLGDVVSVPIPVGGWVELARGTLGTISNTLTVSGLSSKRYYMLLANPLESGQISSGWRLGSGTIDTDSNYAFRRGRNGSETIFTTTTGAGFVADSLVTSNQFGVGYVANVSDKEKILQSSGVSGITGAANAPNKYKIAAKWVNTSNAADVAGLFNFGSGTFDVGTELVVLGWDPADTHTNNFWEELASVELTSGSTNLSSGTIPAKKYLWIQCYSKGTGGNINTTFNNDSGNNYSRRFSVDGGSDGTDGSLSSISNMHNGGRPGEEAFSNWFVINNSSNEKFVTGKSVQQNTAGAANPPARVEFVAKWANTTSQITEIDFDSVTGSFAGGSFLKVWGAN